MNFRLILHLLTMPDKDTVGNRWSKQELQIFYQSKLTCRFRAESAALQLNYFYTTYRLTLIGIVKVS